MANLPSLLLAATLLAAALPACSEYASTCQKVVNCEGGNDKDVAACAETLEGLENAADAYGCLDKFDDFMKCRDSGTCTNNHFTADCSSQEDALNACVKSASGKKT